MCARTREKDANPPLTSCFHVLAWSTAFLPTEASTTSSVSCGAL